MRKLALLTVFALAACSDDGSSFVPGPSRDLDSGASDVGTRDTAVPPDVGGEDTTAADTATPDTATPDTGSDRDGGEPVNIGRECADITFAADNAYRAADIIWVIDTSESMDAEITQVRTNINTFVESIEDSGVDVRMVMVASKEDRTIQTTQVIPGFGEITVPQGYLGVCVPEPLSAAPGCPDTDNPPVFLHPDVNVYSTDALQRLMEDAYPQFRTILRRSARTHIVVVSDDSSSKSADWFRDQTRLVDPPGFSLDYAFHSIVALGSGSCGEGEGGDYLDLSRATGGVISDICLGSWEPIFDALLEGVVNDAEIPCAFGLPQPEDGLTINFNQVNVFHTPIGGEPELVYNVDSAEDCTAAGGWYYDDPREPTAIWICDALCGGAVEGTIDIEFGCRTIKE